MSTALALNENINDNIVHIDSKYLEFPDRKVTNIKLSNINASLEKIQSYISSDKIGRGIVKKCKKNGDLVIDFEDMDCIMKRNDVSPVIEQDGNVHKAKCVNRLGMPILFNVKSIEDNTVYLSRKEIIANLRKEYAEKIKLNTIVEGRIYSIDETFGCYVDLGADFTAFLPKKYLERTFVSKIINHVKIGDMVKGMIVDIKYNKDETEIQDLVIDRAVTLPSYNELLKDYESGDVVIGTIIKISPTGIYSKLTEHLGVTCFFNNKFTDLKVGDQIKIKIKIKSNDDKTKITGDIVGLI